MYISDCSAAREHVRVPPGLQAFVVKLLARDERFNELHQFIAGKLVEPSRAVALQLVEVGTHHTPTRKLGMEMLRLLHAHSDYVKLLLQDGRMLEGLRYIRRNKVVLSLFLSCASSNWACTFQYNQCSVPWGDSFMTCMEPILLPSLSLQ